VSRIIIAIGGSGQMVLHHYVQLYLIGVIEERFDAYVLDSDHPIESLRFLSGFFDDVRQALGQDSVPSIRLVPLESGGEGASVAKLLTGVSLPEQPGFQHPVQAFFLRDTLIKDVRSGLFARPALSAVMALKNALAEVDPRRLSRDARIVLVCSCIGGTGAGVAIPLLWYLANTPGTQFQLDAVLLGDYFVPRKESAVGDDVARFHSNRIAFLNALGESVSQLRAFALVEEPKMPERDSQKEQQAKRLSWSEASQPYWQATAAVQHLLDETVTSRAEKFADRLVRAAAYRGKLDQGAAGNRLNRSHGCVTSILRHRALLQVGREAAVRSMWGDALINSLVGYWTLTNKAGSTLSPSQFLRELDRQVRRLWDGGLGEYCLSRIFPECRPDRIPPELVRRVGWFAPPQGMSPDPFRDPERGVQRVASAFLYGALRNVR
jgi:hypothetical protein